jgi:parvulin-like peptidyl-prolyl isomerase
MTIFKCEKCNKEFNRKSTYTSHIMRINSCIKNIPIINECEYCKKLYSNKYKLKIHMNTCKEKSIIDNITQIQLEELKKMLYDQKKKFEEQQKDNNELKKKVEELSHLSDNKQISNNNITVTENSNNNITNNINIYSSGKEDLSILSKEDIIKLCTSGTYYPIVAVEILHCNEKYPEFQNVLISNLRSSTGLVKINNKWETKSHDELLTNIMRVDKKHISNLMKDLEIDNKLQIKLESTQDEIDTNESKEHHKCKIKQKLYDASKMIAKTKKDSENLSNL